MSRMGLLILCACATAQLGRDVPPGRVDGPTARQLVADGARLVDVRAPDSYAEGHIEGAVNIPWQEMEARTQEIGPVTTPIVLYCRTGKGATNAYATLTRIGYRRVYNLGSYLNWGEGAPAPTPLPGAAAMPQDTCPAGPTR